MSPLNTPTTHDAVCRKADKIAVRAVSMVADQIYNGTLPAYGGILAAREIKAMIVKQFAPKPKKRAKR